MLFIFGQSEKGLFCQPTLCKNILDLLNYFGHPPALTQGLFFATQTLLMQKPCVFFRVEEEGFSLKDYFKGLDILKSSWDTINLHAIGMPGVGNLDVFEKLAPLCQKKRSLILLSERDLFDYLTN